MRKSDEKGEGNPCLWCLTSLAELPPMSKGEPMNPPSAEGGWRTVLAQDREKRIGEGMRQSPMQKKTRKRKMRPKLKRPPKNPRKLKSRNSPFLTKMLLNALISKGKNHPKKMEQKKTRPTSFHLPDAI